MIKTRKEAREYYVSMDDRIDVERLISLDGMLRSKLGNIRRDPQRPTKRFMAGERLDPAAPTRLGTQAINLTNQISGGYDGIQEAACWEKSADAAEFPEIMAFIETLPLVSYGRAFIIFDYDGITEPPHRDHGDSSVRQEFIWFRTNKAKKFYIYDKSMGQKHYVDSYSCWFDTRHYHGTDSTEGLSLSIRVDGIFTEELRAFIAGQQWLVQPRDLSVLEKVKRRWYFFRREQLSRRLPAEGGTNPDAARSLSGDS